MPQNTKIQHRRDTATNWTSVNPILDDGEIGYDKTNNQIRVGDGTSTWSALSPLVSNITSSSFSSQIISTRAWDATNNGGQIYLNGATGNRIDFNSNGSDYPTFTTRSVGTKIVLLPAVSASNTDVAVGIHPGPPSGFWSSVPNNSWKFAWYAGTTEIASLSGGGNFTSGKIIASPTNSGTQAIDVTSFDATQIGIRYTAATAQSANMQEWRNSASTVLASVNSSGGLYAQTLQVVTVPYAYGRKVTTYTVPSVAESPPWENVVTQGGITYNATTKQFTMPRAGVLTISSAFNLPTSSAANNTYVQIRKNGVAMFVTSQTVGSNANGGAAWSWTATGTMLVNANDLIEVYWRCQGVSNINTTDGNNYVSMVYIG